MPPTLPTLAPESNPFRYMWDLGYHRLCPIIPPDAPLSPESEASKRMERQRARGKPVTDSRGKAPGIKGRDGLWRGFNFVRHESAEDDTQAWHAMGAGVGIKTGRGLVAVDIDTMDEDAARLIANLAFQMLGPAPIRFGRRPKALLPYRISGDVAYERVSFRSTVEERAAVEVLYEGRQFVAYGLHPATGSPYFWRNGPVPLDDLPEITPDDLEAFLEAVAAALPAGARTLFGEGKAPANQAVLRGKPDVVREAIAHLPNRDADFPIRDDYTRVGYAIKAAFGPDEEELALECFHQWAGRWDAGENDPGDVESDWSRMHPPFRVGASWLYEQAEKLGGWTGRGRAYFEPVGAVDLEAAAGVAEEALKPAVARDGRLYEVLDLEDVLDLPAPRWLIDRHIPEAAPGFLYGRPGCGKSFLALDMALHIAYGIPEWHGDAVTPREGAHVLYLAREGAAGFASRIKAWQQGRLLPHGRKAFFGLIRETINFTVPDDIHRLIETVEATGRTPLDLIVVDTVSRSIPGADENKQADMSLFVTACEALHDCTGAAVLGVHHAGKNGDMRGSTVLAGAGDYLLRLDRKPEAKIGYLRCEKQKDAADGWSDAYAFANVVFGPGKDENSLVPHRLAPEEAEQAADEAGTVEEMSEQHRGILAAMEAAWEMEQPWSKAPQSKERYAPRRAVVLFDLRADEALALLARWEKAGIIREEVYGTKTKKRGYRVVRGAAGGGSILD